MANIVLNFSARHPQHIHEPAMSRIEYILDRFSLAKELAKVQLPSYVSGILPSCEIDRVFKRTGLQPIEKQATRKDHFYRVVYEIGCDTTFEAQTSVSSKA